MRGRATTRRSHAIAGTTNVRQTNQTSHTLPADVAQPLVLAVSRSETMRRHERPRIVHGSAADYYFAQFVTGQEEFQALETVKEFFQAPIVEDLLRLALAAVGYQQGFGILNTE